MIFVVILSIELDGIRARKLNAERVIIFRSVILLRAQGVNNYAQIRKDIPFQLDLCDRGGFDELVKYTYNSALLYPSKISWQ